MLWPSTAPAPRRPRPRCASARACIALTRTCLRRARGTAVCSCHWFMRAFALHELCQSFCTASLPRIRRLRLAHWQVLRIPVADIPRFRRCSAARCYVLRALLRERLCPPEEDLDSMDLHGVQRPIISKCTSTSDILPCSLVQSGAFRFPLAGLRSTPRGAAIVRHFENQPTVLS